MADKLTDKEIIKAIEHCKNNEGNGCRGCVFYGNEKGTCIDELLTDALDLINCQQAEIERLSNSAKQWEDTAKDLFISKEKQQADIEELKSELKITREYLHNNGLECDLLSYATRKEMVGEDK